MPFLYYVRELCDICKALYLTDVRCTAVQEEGTGARIMEIVDPWVTKNADPDVPHMPPMLLDWDFICAHFAALYCNWQPTMFEHQDALHV